MNLPSTEVLWRDRKFAFLDGLLCGLFIAFLAYVFKRASTT